MTRACQDPQRKNFSPFRVRRKERRAAARGFNQNQDVNFGIAVIEPPNTNQVAEEATYTVAIDDTILENGRLCDELTPPETGEESFNIIIQDGVVADNVADEEVFKNQRDADEVNTLENDNKGIEVCTNTVNEEAESSDLPVPEVLDIVVPASNDKEQVAISLKEDDMSQEWQFNEVIDKVLC